MPAPLQMRREVEPPTLPTTSYAPVEQLRAIAVERCGPPTGKRRPGGSPPDPRRSRHDHRNALTYPASGSLSSAQFRPVPVRADGPQVRTGRILRARPAALVRPRTEFGRFPPCGGRRSGDVEFLLRQPSHGAKRQRESRSNRTRTVVRGADTSVPPQRVRRGGRRCQSACLACCRPQTTGRRCITTRSSSCRSSTRRGRCCARRTRR